MFNHLVRLVAEDERFGVAVTFANLIAIDAAPTKGPSFVAADATLSAAETSTAQTSHSVLASGGSKDRPTSNVQRPASKLSAQAPAQLVSGAVCTPYVQAAQILKLPKCSSDSC